MHNSTSPLTRMTIANTDTEITTDTTTRGVKLDTFDTFDVTQ